jgi:2-polyprenyl-3-methyl-5-hydroxy-6-metoxy-1,4-benzoquinol methylase
MEDRNHIFQEYYKFDDPTMLKIEALSTSPRENYFEESFKRELASYGVNAVIMRTMLQYTRYRKSDMIIEFLGSKLNGMKVLDFGCGIGDYGMAMARCGAQVTFCDFPELIDFVQFRWQKESLNCNAITALGIEDEQKDPNYDALSKGNFDLAIFGEVLEHISHPLKLLETLQNVPYIFTSSFPFKREISFHEPGHNLGAYQEQKLCLQLLEKNYKCNTLLSVLKMWCKL